VGGTARRCPNKCIQEHDRGVNSFDCYGVTESLSERYKRSMGKRRASTLRDAPSVAAAALVWSKNPKKRCASSGDSGSKLGVQGGAGGGSGTDF